MTRFESLVKETFNNILIEADKVVSEFLTGLTQKFSVQAMYVLFYKHTIMLGTSLKQAGFTENQLEEVRTLVRRQLVETHGNLYKTSDPDYFRIE